MCRVYRKLLRRYTRPDRPVELEQHGKTGGAKKTNNNPKRKQDNVLFCVTQPVHMSPRLATGQSTRQRQARLGQGEGYRRLSNQSDTAPQRDRPTGTSYPCDPRRWCRFRGGRGRRGRPWCHGRDRCITLAFTSTMRQGGIPRFRAARAIAVAAALPVVVAVTVAAIILAGGVVAGAAAGGRRPAAAGRTGTATVTIAARFEAPGSRWRGSGPLQGRGQRGL